MKTFLLGLVIGSVITNAAWLFRVRIGSWLRCKEDAALAAANEAMDK